MKTRISLACLLALTLGTMPFAGGCAQTAAQSAAATNSIDSKVSAASPTNAANAVAGATETSPELAATTAPAVTKPALVKPVMEEPPPANLKISPALREIIKLAKSGVGKDVLIAFAEDSKDRFGLGTDEIIYLNDLGVADEVTTAMIERDRVLRDESESAATAMAAVTPEPAAAIPQPAPVAEATLYAPQYQGAAAPALEPAVEQSVATPDSDATYFYDSLAPYGNWVNVSGYGLCWQPTAAVTTPTWRPYLDCGRWVWSDSGWYWHSDYSWGWAPFHYGRWFYHGNHGWVWNPGRTWGPAWVSWRNSDDYCGWAPLPPAAGFVSGIGLTWYGSGVSADFEFGLGWSSYCFTPVARFCDNSPRRHVVHHDRGHDAWKHTKVVNKIKIKGDNNTVIVDGNGKTKTRIKGDNNTVIFEGGADPRHVETTSRSPVRRVRVKDADGGGARGHKPDHIEREGSEFVVYKPELPGKASDRAKTAIAKVAAQPSRTPERIRNADGRSERSPGNLKAADARNSRADDRKTSSVAVAPPAPAPAFNNARVNPSDRLRDRESSNERVRPGAQTTDVPKPRDNERDRSSTTVVRTPESLVVRGNNSTPARNQVTPPASRIITSGSSRTATPVVEPLARIERPRANEQPKTEAARSGDARAARSVPMAGNTRPTTPTPVTRATPISEPIQRERVQPIRVWNPPAPETATATQPNQPNVNRSYNAPNTQFRGYAPAPNSTPSFENSRQDRNVSRNDGRSDRSPAMSAPAQAPAYQAPPPSTPDRSRNEAVRVERDRSNDNNSNNRANNDRGGNSGGGGGGGGGGGRNNDDGGNRSGRNR